MVNGIFCTAPFSRDTAPCTGAGGSGFRISEFRIWYRVWGMGYGVGVGHLMSNGVERGICINRTLKLT